MKQELSENERQFLNNLNRHLQNIPAKCPYGLPHQAIYRMAKFGVIPEEIMGILLAAGYRRYGDTIYTMGCEDCRSCIPIKLDPFEFFPNRNQKRSSKRNSDLTIERNPLTADKEKTALLQNFFDRRYPGKNNSAGDYYAGFFLNSSGFSAEIRYCSDGELLGVSIIDIGRTWLNAVYFFFEPESSKRSLGTFNITHLIDLCKEQNIHNLYLGYWIKESRAMNYKAAFLPHYILVDGSWSKVTQPPTNRP
ncbi:MAG: arginyltransferase [Thermodesulfobacteriota bacterium]